MPELHVFIDTNVFLNFYSFPDDKSSVLQVLIDLMGPDEINVHLPKQVEDEFWRNRESKIHAAVLEFKNATLPTAVPNHMRGADTAKQYKDAIDAAASARKKLIANVVGLAVLEQLEIDVQVRAVFAAAIKHDDSDETLARAVARMHKGNPPGKPGNVGDRYNWETLLHVAPTEDLHVVTKDGDFTTMLGSVGKTPRTMSFLAKEWAVKAPGRSVYVYTSIQELLSYYEKLAAQPEEAQALPEDEHAEPEEVQPQDLEEQVPLDPAPEAVALPPVQLPGAQQPPPVLDPAIDLAKQQAIAQLVNSESFQLTHRAIAKLSKVIPSITVEDADKLFAAATENQQIRWIISDSDVRSFYLEVLNMHFIDADSDLVDEMIDLLGLKADEEMEDEV
jgi:hypothetical protein